MSKWGSADFKKLENLQRKMKKISKVDYERFCKKQVKQLAARFLRKVIKRTPVGTGELKRGWVVSKVIKKGSNYQIEVINKKLYSSYVEYGHRQQIGRFVPALGKRLVKGWVEGRFMMTITEQEIKRDAPKILEKEFERFIGEIFNDK